MFFNPTYLEDCIVVGMAYWAGVCLGISSSMYRAYNDYQDSIYTP